MLILERQLASYLLVVEGNKILPPQYKAHVHAECLLSVMANGYDG